MVCGEFWVLVWGTLVGIGASSVSVDATNCARAGVSAIGAVATSDCGGVVGDWGGGSADKCVGEFRFVFGVGEIVGDLGDWVGAFFWVGDWGGVFGVMADNARVFILAVSQFVRVIIIGGCI